jgi:hypothetical protein
MVRSVFLVCDSALKINILCRIAVRHGNVISQLSLLLGRYFFITFRQVNTFLKNIKTKLHDACWRA